MNKIAFLILVITEEITTESWMWKLNLLSIKKQDWDWIQLFYSNDQLLNPVPCFIQKGDWLNAMKTVICDNAQHDRDIRWTINSTGSHTMHILVGIYNKGIPRMWPDFPKSLLRWNLDITNRQGSGKICSL